MNEETKEKIKAALLEAGCPQESVDHVASYNIVDVYVAVWKCKQYLIKYKEKYAFQYMQTALENIKLSWPVLDDLLSRFKGF